MSRLSLLALQDEHFAACWTSISLPARRFETTQERSAGGLALIISALFSGEGWGGVGFGRGTDSGPFLWPVWYSVSCSARSPNLFAGQCCSSPQNYLKVK